MKSAYFKTAGTSIWLMAIWTCAAWALSVAPVRTEVSLLPGAVTKAVITVTNPHAEPYDVELSEKPWFIYPENKQIQVDQWLHLPDPKEFRLKAGKSRDVKVTISCPKDAVGELMGMVSFAYHGMQPSMITPMISTAIYLRVTGTEKNTGEIVALGAGTRNGRFQVGTQIKATGNVRLRPNGSIRLLDQEGKEVALYTVTEGNPIFPGSLRDYGATGPDKAPPPGRYKLSADISSGTYEMKNETEILVKANGDVEMVAKKEAEKL